MSESEQKVSQNLKKAVALKYIPGQSEAPVVVAKGQGSVADIILQKAKENGVAVQEDAALVEVLSKLDLDQQIRLSSISWWLKFLAMCTRVTGQPGNGDRSEP